jgi:glycosyltransferase involved in cell wall biosynthesis
VSGVSAVTQFIVRYNTHCDYTHFALGKRDGETRNVLWFCRLLVTYVRWIYVVVIDRRAIIHFNLAFEFRSLIRDSPLIIIARLFRRRVIAHIHGGRFLAGGGMPSWLEGLARVALGSGPVVVLSPLEKAWLTARLPDSKVSVLPNCVAVDEAKTFERPYPSDEPMTLLYLGRISVSKGIDVIYDTLKVLQERGVRVRFVLAGAGPDEVLYVSKFRELLGNAFSFKGVVVGAHKTQVLKECDVFLLPSRFEGLPMALLECMAFGVVPITTDVGSIPTVVTHGLNGFLIPQDGAADIVTAIETLSADKQYMHRLSRNAQRRILDNATAEQYVSALNRIYQHD